MQLSTTQIYSETSVRATLGDNYLHALWRRLVLKKPATCL